MFLNIDLDKRRAEHEREQRAEFDKLPDGIRKWALSIESDGRRQVATIRKAAAQQRQPLESAAGDAQKRIDRLQGELDDAQQWLAAIPAEAEPSAVSQRLTVQATWPRRIQQQRDELARIRQQIADVQRRADRDIDAVRVGIDATVLDVIKRLQTMPINILS